MNIFVLDIDPIKSATMLCDVHVVKMILESCQLLSTDFRCNFDIKGGDYNDLHLYKSTHVNHPCRLCLDNYNNHIWLIFHTYALIKEYEYRYGRIHKSYDLFKHYWELPAMNKYWNNFVNNVNVNDFVENYKITIENTSLPKCMPDEYKIGNTNNINEVVESYRNYYKFKSHSLKRFNYTKREQPIWLNN